MKFSKVILRLQKFSLFVSFSFFHSSITRTSTFNSSWFITCKSENLLPEFTSRFLRSFHLSVLRSSTLKFACSTTRTFHESSANSISILHIFSPSIVPPIYSLVPVSNFSYLIIYMQL